MGERRTTEKWTTKFGDAWPFTFPRHNLSKLIDRVPDEELETRWRQIERHPDGPLHIPYTEHRIRFVALRLHATKGQIDPAYLRRMRNIDLEYLAGSTEPFGRGDWATRSKISASSSIKSRDEATASIESLKVAENAIRAERELNRRTAIRSTVLSAVVGAGAALVVSYFPDLVDAVQRLF